MAQQQQQECLQKEGRLSLAIQSINLGQFQSQRAAAKSYDVPRETLRDQLRGTRPRRDCIANNRKLTDLEGSVIIQRILDLDSRGFGPQLAQVEDMANQLRTTRGQGNVGINWASNFVRRTPGLKMRFDRKQDYQRAQNEDPDIIRGWFELVHNTNAKYGDYR